MSQNVHLLPRNFAVKKDPFFIEPEQRVCHIVVSIPASGAGHGGSNPPRPLFWKYRNLRCFVVRSRHRIFSHSRSFPRPSLAFLVKLKFFDGTRACIQRLASLFSMPVAKFEYSQAPFFAIAAAGQFLHYPLFKELLRYTLNVLKCFGQVLSFVHILCYALPLSKMQHQSILPYR